MQYIERIPLIYTEDYLNYTTSDIDEILERIHKVFKPVEMSNKYHHYLKEIYIELLILKATDGIDRYDSFGKLNEKYVSYFYSAIRTYSQVINSFIFYENAIKENLEEYNESSSDSEKSNSGDIKLDCKWKKYRNLEAAGDRKYSVAMEILKFKKKEFKYVFKNSYTPKQIRDITSYEYSGAVNILNEFHGFLFKN